MTIGQRIKHRREQLGLAQNYVAEQIGVSKQTLYKYEKDIVTNIPLNVIDKIANVLNVSPAYIMGWKKELTDVMDLIEGNKINFDLSNIPAEKEKELYNLYRIYVTDFKATRGWASKIGSIYAEIAEKAIKENDLLKEVDKLHKKSDKLVNKANIIYDEANILFEEAKSLHAEIEVLTKEVDKAKETASKLIQKRNESEDALKEALEKYRIKNEDTDDITFLD